MFFQGRYLKAQSLQNEIEGQLSLSFSLSLFTQFLWVMMMQE
jgi:hypothetical protein